MYKENKAEVGYFEKPLNTCELQHQELLSKGSQQHDKSQSVGYLWALQDPSFSERIDPRHLNHLLSSCASICKLSLVHVKISKLPELCYLSYNHAYIHLENCELQEDPMPKLEQLPNLRVLELCYDTFQGKEMFCSAQGFHSHSC
ncbi:hypothetical protein V6N13_072496 [Hibiscus sabdariffa]